MKLSSAFLASASVISQQSNYGGINEPELIITAFSAHKRLLFGDILKSKKDIRVKIGKGITYSISFSLTYQLNYGGINELELNLTALSAHKRS